MSEATEKTLDDQIKRAEELLRDSLWAAEQARIALIRLKVQKDMILLARKL